MGTQGDLSAWAKLKLALPEDMAILTSGIAVSALLLIGLAVFLIIRTIFEDEENYKAGRQLDENEASKEKDQKKLDFVLKVSVPFFRRYVTPIVHGMKNRAKIKDQYKRRLASAGLTQTLTSEEFYSFKLFLIVGFPITYMLVRGFLEADWPLIYVPLVGIGGFFYPDLWIKGRITKRQSDVITEMPFIVDMLALSVEAGLDFIAAMSRVVEKAPPGPLSEEFDTLMKEIKVGASRGEALRNLSWRVDMISIASFCATLIAADSVGASIGPILKTLSKEIRQKRSAEIEKKASQAATKLIVVTILIIVPAVFIMMIGPQALQLKGE